MFYKPKHAKKNLNSPIERTKRAVVFVWDEVKWYCNWWKDLLLHKPIDYGVIAIDKFDEVVDRFGGESTMEEIS